MPYEWDEAKRLATMRGDIVRIISMRKANDREAQHYVANRPGRHQTDA